MSEDSKSELKQLAEVLVDRLGDLEQTNQIILEKIEDLQEASAQSKVNQVKFFFEHDRMIEQVDEVLKTINNSVASLSIQIRDMNSLIKRGLV